MHTPKHGILVDLFSDGALVRVRRDIVLASLFNRAKAQGMSYFDYFPKHVMTLEEAGDLIQRQQYFDYLEGRWMKIVLNLDQLHTAFYNRENGPKTAENAILDYLTKP